MITRIVYLGWSRLIRARSMLAMSLVKPETLVTTLLSKLPPRNVPRNRWHVPARDRGSRSTSITGNRSTDNSMTLRWMARSGRSNSDVERKKTRDRTRRKTKDGGCGPRFFRLFDVSSLAANQRLSLLYEKLPCLSHTHFSLTHFALYPSPFACSSLSVSLSLPLPLSLSDRCSLAPVNSTVPLHWRATDPSSSSLSPFLYSSYSLHSFFLRRLRFRCSLVHALRASLSFFLHYRSSPPWSFSFLRACDERASIRESSRVHLFTLRPLDYLLIHETKKVCVNAARVLNIAGVAAWHGRGDTRRHLPTGVAVRQPRRCTSSTWGSLLHTCLDTFDE